MLPQKLDLELMRSVADSLVEEEPAAKKISHRYFYKFQAKTFYEVSVTSYFTCTVIYVDITEMGISPPPLHHHLQRDFHCQQPPPSLLHHLPEINFEFVNSVISYSFIYTRNL